MVRKFLYSTAASAAILCGVPAVAGDPSGREFGYFLPRTRVAATVQQQIQRCPTAANERPLVLTTISIVDKLGADPDGFARVDARSGFLTGRTTHLELRQNGTLAAFNATTQGEGGPVLSAVIGAAANLASWSVGVPGVGAALSLGTRPSGLTCNETTAALVQRLQEVEAQIASLQAQVAQGTQGSAAALVLTDLRTEHDDLKEKLTLSSPEPVLFDVSPADFAGSAASQSRLIAPIDYGPWFGGSASRAARLVVGAWGFRARLTPNRALFQRLRTGDGSALPADASPYLFYRRPVPAVVAVAPCAGTGADNDCTVDETPFGQEATGQKSVLLPQLSGLFHIRIGNGNIFGTRRAVASFDEQGAPTVLEYGSTPGGADMAGVINATMTGLAAYRDAETTAVNRRVAQLKAVKELQDALAAAEAK